jgi:small subunit ribosomal protein S8
MAMTDPIADLLARIRNAQRARHRQLLVPGSRVKLEIVKILTDSGYLEGHETVEEDKRMAIRIQLKYARDGEAAITGMERISRPGRRVYCGKAEIPRVLDGLGITIISTPHGVMTGAACSRRGVGGEVLCNVW